MTNGQYSYSFTFISFLISSFNPMQMFENFISINVYEYLLVSDLSLIFLQKQLTLSIASFIIDWLLEFFLAGYMSTFINDGLCYIYIHIFVHFMTYYVNDKMLEPKNELFSFQLRKFCTIEIMDDDLTRPLKISMFVFQTNLLMAVIINQYKNVHID